MSQNHTALFGSGYVQVVRRGGPRGNKFQLRVASQESGIDPRVDEDRDDFRIGRNFLGGIGEHDIVTGQAIGEKWLFVVLGLNKNDFHGKIGREMLLPQRRQQSVMIPAHETRPICHF